MTKRNSIRVSPLSASGIDQGSARSLFLTNLDDLNVKGGPPTAKLRLEALPQDKPVLRVTQNWRAEFSGENLSVVSQATREEELRPTRELDACDTTT